MTARHRRTATSQSVDRVNSPLLLSPAPAAALRCRWHPRSGTGAPELPGGGPDRRRDGSGWRSRLLGGTALVAATLVLPAASPQQAACAEPTSGSVAAGSGSITTTAAQTLVTQTSNRAVFTWQSLSLKAGEKLIFQQPGSTAIALNRVTGGSVSQIDGSITANGQVWLLNPNGVVFGKGSQTSVGGLIATTSDMSNAAFTSGSSNFDQASPVAGAAVRNLGTIKAADGGSVVLSAERVSNDGVVTATLGTVVLGGAKTFTVDMGGDGLLRYAITTPASGAGSQGSGDAVVSNTGTLSANGGKVLVTAKAASQISDNLINAGGVIEAKSASLRNGAVVLDGGDGAVAVTGKIDVSGSEAGQTGGSVSVSGGTIRLSDSASLDARGQSGGGSVVVGDWTRAQSVTLERGSVIDASASGAGKGGSVTVIAQKTTVNGTIRARGGVKGGDGGSIETSGKSLTIGKANIDAGSTLGRAGSWTLDPLDLTIGDTAASTISTTLATSNVTIQTTETTASSPGTTASGTGEINISSAISWSADTMLTLDSYHGISVGANITASGTNAGLTVKTNTGNSDTSGQFKVVPGSSVTLSGANASLTINGNSYTLLRNAAAVQAMGTSGFYALAGDISLAGVSNFTPIGYNSASGSGNNGIVSQTGVNAAPTAFTGTLDGLGHTLIGLTISSSGNNLGLFSKIGNTGRVANLALSNALLQVNSTTTSGFGLVAGSSAGTLYNVRAAGAIQAGDNATGAGLLTGYNTGQILYGGADGQISAGAQAKAIGGAVGANSGSISYSYAQTAVTVGDNAQQIGGLTGSNSGTLSYVYAGSTLQTGTGATSVGGLSGDNSGTISIAYSSGAVTTGTGATSVGGLVGTNQSGASIKTTYSLAALSASGGSKIGGLVGTNSGSASLSGWDKTLTGQTVACGSGSCTTVFAVPSATVSTLGALAGFDFTSTWSTTSSGGIALQGVTPSSANTQNVSWSVSNSSFVYGSTGDLTSTTVTLTGVTTGDDVAPVITLYDSATGLEITPTARTSVGSYIEVVSGLTGADASKYSLAGSGNSNGTLSVTQKSLTWSVAPVSTTYGTVAALQNGSLSGVVSGDSLTAVVGLFNSAGTQVAPSKTLGAGSYTQRVTGVSGAAAANYLVTPITNDANTAGSYRIDPATLTASVVAATRTYGSDNPAFSVAYSGFVNGETSAVVTAAPSYSTKAGKTSGVGSYDVTLGGSFSAANYQIAVSDTPGTLTVTPATLTVTAANASKVYGDAVSTSLGVTYSGFVNGDSSTVLTKAPTVSTTATQTSAVGSYATSASGGAAANYSLTYVDGTYTVTQKPLTWSLSNATQTYGQTGAAAATLSGVLSGDTVSAVLGVVGGGDLAKAGVGTYTVTATGLGGASAANYKLADGAATASVTVNPATLTVTANNQSKVYGSANPALSVSYSGFVNGETSTVLTSAPTTSTTATAASGVGSYGITVSGGTAANYTISTVNGTLTVTPAPLTVTADSLSKVYGSANPTLTYRLSGLVNGDSSAVLTAAPTLSTTATTASGVGSYAISASGGTAANYSITTATGTLTVTPKALTASLSSGSMSYGATTSAATVTGATLSGLIGSDAVTPVVTVGGVADLSKASIGSYTATLSGLSGSAASNYTLSDNPTASLTVNKRALSWSVSNASVTATALTLPTATLSGVVNSDSVLGVLGLTDSSGKTVTLSDITSRGTGNSYTMSVTGLSGSGAGNYALSSSGNSTGVLSFGSSPVIKTTTPDAGTVVVMVQQSALPNLPKQVVLPASVMASAKVQALLNLMAPASPAGSVNSLDGTVTVTVPGLGSVTAQPLPAAQADAALAGISQGSVATALPAVPGTGGSSSDSADAAAQAAAKTGGGSGSGSNGLAAGGNSGEDAVIAAFAKQTVQPARQSLPQAVQLTKSLLPGVLDNVDVATLQTVLAGAQASTGLDFSASGNSGRW